MKRRVFLKSAMATGAGLMIFPNGLRGQTAPGNKLNVALIGTWGRGLAHFDSLADENVVALCDVWDRNLVDAAKRFPNAKTYSDWRKCLEQKDIDAVVICTTDFTHAFVANWALNRGKHVYLEKPLGITVEEARVVRANWLPKKGKLATQVGMQRHAHDNFNRIAEMIRDGAIGELKSAYAWGNRKIPKPGYLPAGGTPPDGLHYDLWLGPVKTDHPYNPEYFSGKAGANCLQWNMYWDFGTGQIGDMGSHTMDLLWNAVDCALPTSAEAKGEPFNPDVTPVNAEMRFEHPANSWRGPIGVSWYQGGAMPNPPSSYVDINKIGHGAMFKGSEGILVADFTSRALIPLGKDGSLSYYTPRKKEALLPPVGHFQKQWINACKNPSLKTACDFEYSANMIEQMCLGLVAYRVGKKLDYDGKAGRVTNSAEADALLKREYRAGWTLNG
ncbi:MAG TPA: Gfo/Idh/MocA family oxidoreductase [Kiritimatiellia bacterium]|nr:Gfo/Idh/MocA family oxidoreductase [Kiritimatiellia bacterium]